MGGLVAAASHAVELQPRDDGLGEWGGGRGGRGWGSVVVILTTHNGRLLHLQTTVFRGTRERREVGREVGRERKERGEEKKKKKEGGKKK